MNASQIKRMKWIFLPNTRNKSSLIEWSGVEKCLYPRLLLQYNRNSEKTCKMMEDKFAHKFCFRL